jgi:hypothetical protein
LVIHGLWLHRRPPSQHSKPSLYRGQNTVFANIPMQGLIMLVKVSTSPV